MSFPDPSDRFYFFVIANLPSEWGWQELKDFIRETTDRPGFTEVIRLPSGESSQVGWFKVKGRDEAVNVYSMLLESIWPKFTVTVFDTTDNFYAVQVATNAAPNDRVQIPYAPGPSGVPINAYYGVVPTEFRCVCVTNLKYSTTEVDLVMLFGQYGIVESCEVKRDKDTGASRGTAIIEFSSTQEAQRSVANLNGTVRDGRTIGVRLDVNAQTAVNRRRPIFEEPIIANGSNPQSP